MANTLILETTESNDTLEGEGLGSQLPSVYKHCRARSDEMVEKQSRHISFHPMFNYVALILIAVAAVEVGVQIESAKSSDRYLMARGLHMGLNVFFIVEAVLRLHGLGWEFLSVSWNVLDFLVAISCIFDLSNTGLYEENLRIRVFVVLRVVRIFLLIRTPSIVARYRELWLLIHGFVEGFTILLYVAIVSVFVMYFAACLLTYDVASHSFAIRDQAHWNSPHIYFGTTVRTFLTLFQGLTFDRWSTNIARPLADAGRYFSVAVYILFIIGTGYGLFKVVIAVFIERCLSVSVESESRVKVWSMQTEHELMEIGREDFDNLARRSPDGAGVSFDEFKQTGLVELKEILKAMRIGNSQVAEIYRIVDIGHSGRISTEQFVKAVLRFRGDARARDLVYIMSLIKTSEIKCGLIKADLDLFDSEVHQLGEAVDEMDTLMHQIALKHQEAINARQRDSVARTKKEKLHLTLTTNPRLGVPEQVAEKYRKSRTEVQIEYLETLGGGLLDPSNEGMRASTFINVRKSRRATQK